MEQDIQQVVNRRNAAISKILTWDGLQTALIFPNWAVMMDFRTAELADGNNPCQSGAEWNRHTTVN